MDFIRTHQKAFRIIMVIALGALIISSFLPFAVLLIG